MAIKVDLKKGHNRICWSFFKDTFMDTRFPTSLIDLIMHCVSSYKIWALWKRVMT